MFKKVLIAVFVFSLILALSNAAFAFKDPNHIKRLPNTLPDAAKAGAEFMVAFPDMPPQYSKPMSAAQPASVTGTAYRGPAWCDTYSYWDGTPFWFWTVPDAYGDDFFNMRFTPVDCCTLTTAAVLFYDAGSVVNTASGVDIIVWDDAFGFPGTELARINVPAANVVFHPNYVEVDFTSFNLVFCDDFHIGYTTVDQVNDVFAILSDEGTTGTERSSEYYMGMWGTMYNDWGIDVNFAIEADLCCESGEPPPCEWLTYGTYAAWYFWTIPDAYGDDFFNERLTTGAYESDLTQIELAFYAAGSVDVTGEGVDVYVWDSDGSGFPGAVLAIINVPYASMVMFPGMHTINMTSYGLSFPPGHDFHVGYTTVNQGAGNVMACLSDDGSGDPEYRSSENWNGFWGLMIDDWGLDVDFLFGAEVCYDVGPPDDCYTLWYYGPLTYYWTIPDAYGDDYFNTRFTHVSADCRLEKLRIAFYADGSVGAPGADFILFNSNGTYPTDTIAVYPVPVVTTWFPGMEEVDISGDNLVLNVEYHLGYTPIYNDPGDVLAVLSDDGSTATGRCSENWNGFWGLMVDDWGVDVAFLMEVDICCPGVGVECVDEGEWPTLAHDYARTGYNPVEIGDLCGFQRIWQYWSPYDFCYFATPTIADEIVYVTFTSHAVALNITNGSLIWDTKTADPLYPTIMGGNIRTSMTIADGAVYFSTGTFEGFVKADAYTGAVIWARAPMTANPLEGTAGTMRFCASVVMDNQVFFGGDGGTIYNLDVATGATNVFAATPYGNGIWVSMSSDGTDLYITCSAGLDGGDPGPLVGVGGVYKYDQALNNIWPYGGFTGLLGYDEGSTCGVSYSASTNMLFTVLGIKDHPSFDGYNMKIDAATGDPAVSNYWLCGLGQYANNTLIEPLERWYYGNKASVDARFSGIWCRSYDNNTVWDDFTKGAMIMPAGATCDPYVFWGTQVPPYGTFNCSDAENGDLLFSYNITGYGFGPAIAKYDGVPYVAFTQLWSDCGTGGGAVAMYSIGADRPRLFIPGDMVIDPPIEFTDPDGTQRTADDVFCNVGCVGLEYCLTLEADASYPLKAFTSTVNPYHMARAEKNADLMVDYAVDGFNAMSGWKAARMGHTPMKSELSDRAMGKQDVEITLAGPPSWVTLVSGATGILNGGDCYDATFAFDVPVMGRGENWFYLVVASDDPDFNECPSALPPCNGLPVNAMIHLAAVKGFAFCDGFIEFGAGGDDAAYVNNGGFFEDGDAPVDAIIVDGADDPMYQGSFLMMVDSNRAAWLEEGGKAFNHIFPDASCTFDYGIQVDELCDGTPIFADFFEAAVIDSIFDYTTEQLDNALTIGMRMSYRVYGAFVPSPANYGSSIFNNFYLIAYDMTNRNATPVEGLYWGAFADFDMPGDAAGYEYVLGDIGVSAMWQYNGVTDELSGFGALPMAGSFVNGLATTGMYCGYGVNNPDEIYAPAELPVTIFGTIDAIPAGTVGYHPNAAPGMPPDDRGTIMIAGHQDFAGNEVVQGAMVVFYFPAGATAGEIGDMMAFANKWAGYGRGDLNDDGVIDLLDLCLLSSYAAGVGGPPCPFVYLGDVDLSGDVDVDDALYMYEYMFNGGDLPKSALVR